MALLAVIRLVKSLSSSEKRFFKLHTRQHKGSRDYLNLFDLIDKTATPEVTAIEQKFKQRHPKVSVANTARYLAKLITDCLIQSKTEKDPFFGLLRGIMRAKVLQERSLAKEGHQQLQKIRQLAQNTQKHFIEYLTYRYELNYFADFNFQGLSDKALVETQMKAKNALKNLQHVQDHHTLFELLKYRLIHSGKISSDEDKKRLNDLVLSEMILMTGKSKNSFAEQKLHLLFQSFYFTNIGEYQSALKTFYALNKLFEQNISLLDHPPLDYLSTLNGVLDSLHSLKNYEEIHFYISKISQLDQPVYPEYFRYQVRKTITTYQLAVMTGNKKFPDAVKFIQGFEKGWLNVYNMVDEEKQWELYFYCSLSYFGNREWKKAHRFIAEIMRNHKAHAQQLICKATRLLNIMIHYEMGDMDYLEYEIRSYKRFFQQRHKSLRSEAVLFKFIKAWPDLKRKKISALLHKKLLLEITSLQKDRYERQLLKYFDFTEWIEVKLTKGFRAG